MKTVSKFKILLMVALVASNSTIHPVGFNDISNFVKKHKTEVLLFTAFAIFASVLLIDTHLFLKKLEKDRENLNKAFELNRAYNALITQLDK